MRDETCSIHILWGDPVLVTNSQPVGCARKLHRVMGNFSVCLSTSCARICLVIPQHLCQSKKKLLLPQWNCLEGLTKISLPVQVPNLGACKHERQSLHDQQLTDVHLTRSEARKLVRPAFQHPDVPAWHAGSTACHHWGWLFRASNLTHVLNTLQPNSMMQIHPQLTNVEEWLTSSFGKARQPNQCKSKHLLPKTMPFVLKKELQFLNNPDPSHAFSSTALAGTCRNVQGTDHLLNRWFIWFTKWVLKLWSLVQKDYKTNQSTKRTTIRNPLWKTRPQIKGFLKIGS